MAFSPKYLSFQYDGPTMDGVRVELRDAATLVSIAGALLAPPPLVGSAYQIELGPAGLTPDLVPALAGVSIVADVVVKAGTLSSLPSASDPFTFVEVLPAPVNVTVHD